MNKILTDRFEECGISASDIFDRLIKSDEEQAIFVYTSHLEGLGTKSSDFDVYVISENIPDGEFSRNEANSKVQTSIINGKMLDIEYWTMESIEKIIFNLNNLHYSSVSQDELKFLHRLKVSEVIYENNLNTKIKSMIKQNSLTDFVVNIYLIAANSDLQDAIALYESQEYTCALNCARRSLESAIGALNARNGFTNLKRKWASKIFLDNRKLENKQRIDQYLKYQIYCHIEEENLGLFVGDMLEFIQDIVSAVAFKKEGQDEEI